MKQRFWIPIFYILSLLWGIIVYINTGKSYDVLYKVITIGITIIIFNSIIFFIFRSYKKVIILTISLIFIILTIFIAFLCLYELNTGRTLFIDNHTCSTLDFKCDTRILTNHCCIHYEDRRIEDIKMIIILLGGINVIYAGVNFALIELIYKFKRNS